MKNLVLYAFIRKMANELMSTKDISAAQATCACKDKQHMQVLECALSFEHFRFCFLQATQNALFLSSLLF